MPQLKTGPKVVLAALAVAGLIFGLREAASRGLIPTPGIMKALVPERVVLPDLKQAEQANVDPLPLPSDVPANVQATQIRGEIWEWNAQANMIYANGGPVTTRGSLMEKHGVNLQLVRQDDTGRMQQDLIG